MIGKRTSFGQIGIRGVALITLCGVAGIYGCASQPGRVKFTNENPWTGHTEREYIPTGPTSTLPPGWSPGGEQTIDIVIDGKHYRIRICIARSLANPTCIYVNTGGCAAPDGWQMYCQDTGTSQQFGGPPGFGNHVISDDSSKTLAVNDPALPHCPDEWGSVDFDLTSMTGTVSFTTACYNEPLPQNLVGNVTLTAPGAASLPWQQFNIAYHGTVPVGTVVTMQGSDKALLWNCHYFGRNTLTFTTSDGLMDHVVDVGIAHTEYGPPAALLAVDGEILRIQMLHRPPG